MCCLAKEAIGTEHPYSSIPQRNVFALNAYVPPEPVCRSKPVCPLSITGFVKRGDESTRVLLASRPKEPKEVMRYYKLSEGETDDGVKVVRIGSKQESVELVVDGEPVVLTVQSNSFAIGK